MFWFSILLTCCWNNIKYYFFPLCEINQETKSEWAVYSSDRDKHSIDCFLFLYVSAVLPHIFLKSQTFRSKHKWENPGVKLREPGLPQHILTEQDFLLLFISEWTLILMPYLLVGSSRPLSRSACFYSRTLSPSNCANKERWKKEHSSEEDALVGINLLGSIFKDECCPSLYCFLCLLAFQSSGQRLQGRYDVVLVQLIKLCSCWPHCSSLLCLRLDW